MTRSGAELLSPQQLCDRVPGLTVDALQKARYRGTGPPFMKPNAKVVVYDWASYLEWLRQTEATRSQRFT